MNIKILKTCKLCKCSGEKKYFSLFLFVFSALLSSFAFLSCDGIVQKIDGGGYSFLNNEQEFIITGTLSVDGAVPSEIAKNNLAYAEKSAENESENAKIAESKNARSISGDFESGRGLSGRSARTAFPSIQTSSSYTVSANSGNRTVQGEVNGNSFTIKLSSGIWTVKVEGFSDSARNTKILEGSKTVTLDANTVDNNISITLSPVNEGSGRVNLPISVAADSGIQSAIVKIFEDPGETRPINVNTTLEYDFSTTKDATISASVTAGSRYFVFTFYSVDLTAAKQNPKQNIAYQAHETVNVFQNLETSIWQGNSLYLTDTDTNKKFEITKTLADTFNRKEFYVQGTSGTYTPTTNARDTNSGTYFDPFATLQKAVDKVIAINDGTSPYTIKVDGTLEITTPASTSTENDKSAVSITPTKTLNLTIEGVSTSNKATIKANSSNMRVFIVDNGGSPNIKPNVTMKNLIITGGNNGTGGGGGIRLEAGNLTLSNVEVKDNKTTDIGGGICVEGDSSLTLNDGTEISNNSAENGGGIYVRRYSVASSGILNVTNSEISGNTATRDGGGIYVYGGAKLTMNDCTVSNNSAENGGGIYMASIPAGSSGILNVTNSEISENTASKSGGGIYVSNGNCTINGGTISNNSAASNGGGIFVDCGGCTINGGAISNNKAASKGGGVCLTVRGSSITITGTTRMSGNQLTSTTQQDTGTAIFVSKGATAEISGDVSITQGIAPGGALPTIYLEKGQQESLNSGGSGGSSAIPDAVLKLGGNVQIGNGNGTGIKIEGKVDKTKTNIKITDELTSTQIINISYDDAESGEPFIEGENYTLTQEDCNKFSFDNSTFHLLLSFLGSNKGNLTSN